MLHSINLTLYCMQVVDTLGEYMHPVYADIGPSSLNTKIISVFELDDTRVDYALINHNLPRKETKCSDSEVNKQPGDIILLLSR